MAFFPILADYLCFILILFLRFVLDLIILILSPFLYCVYGAQGKSKKSFESIYITGASSGIGRSTAIEFSAPKTTLYLQGRNIERLNKVKEICESRGANVKVYDFDINNIDTLQQSMQDANGHKPIDLIFANIGVGTSTCSSKYFPHMSLEMLKINILGTLNTIFTILPYFYESKRGHICINGSLLSYTNKPFPTTYPASKVFLRYLSEILRFSLHHYGIDVTIVNPGYVKTPMLHEFEKKNAKEWKVAMSAEKAAKIIKNGLERNLYTIDFPFLGFFASWYIGGLHPIVRHIFGYNSINSNICDDIFLSSEHQQQQQQHQQQQQQYQQHLKNNANNNNNNNNVKLVIQSVEKLEESDNYNNNDDDDDGQELGAYNNNNNNNNNQTEKAERMIYNDQHIKNQNIEKMINNDTSEEDDEIDNNGVVERRIELGIADDNNQDNFDEQRNLLNQ